LPARIIPLGVTVQRPTKHVSVKDVAASCGVSFQTTSKVLNGGGSVSELTRERILRAATDLGYVPNLQARSLVMQRTRTVGLVAGDFSDPGLSRCLAGAEHEARRQGYSLMITSVEPDGSGTEYALPSMLERRVDGILLAAPQMEDDQALAHVLDRTLPVVSLNHIAGATVTTVGPDDEQAGELPTRHLVELGHRAIAVVGGVRGRRLTQSRLRGYRRALADAGIEFSADLVAEGGDSVAGGLEALPRLLERRSDVTAVICHHDLVAVGVLAGLRKLGRRVPDDCSVTRCDDLNSAAYTTPPLTSVHVPFYEIGAEAMRSLLRMITSGSNGAPDVTLPVRLVKRASTAPAA